MDCKAATRLSILMEGDIPRFQTLAYDLTLERVSLKSFVGGFVHDFIWPLRSRKLAITASVAQLVDKDYPSRLRTDCVGVNVRVHGPVKNLRKSFWK